MRPSTERCPATAKGTGEQCRLFVTGGGVCRTHGGNAPQVRAKRLERIALQEQLASADRRHPGEVLLDAVHTLDVVARDLKADVAAGDVSVDAVGRLVSMTGQAAALAKTALDASTTDRLVKAHEARASVQADEVEAFLRAVLGELELSLDDPRVRGAVARVLERGASA